MTDELCEAKWTLETDLKTSLDSFWFSMFHKFEPQNTALRRRQLSQKWSWFHDLGAPFSTFAVFTWPDLSRTNTQLVLLSKVKLSKSKFSSHKRVMRRTHTYLKYPIYKVQTWWTLPLFLVSKVWNPEYLLQILLETLKSYLLKGWIF